MRQEVNTISHHWHGIVGIFSYIEYVCYHLQLPPFIQLWSLLAPKKTKDIKVACPLFNLLFMSLPRKFIYLITSIQSRFVFSLKKLKDLSVVALYLTISAVNLVSAIYYQQWKKWRVWNKTQAVKSSSLPVYQGDLEMERDWQCESKRETDRARNQHCIRECEKTCYLSRSHIVCQPQGALLSPSSVSSKYNVAVDN